MRDTSTTKVAFPDCGPAAAYEFICQVKQELKTKNRFHADKRLDVLIKLYANKEFYHMTLPENHILLRARIYNEDDAKERYVFPPEDTPFKGYDEKNSFVNLNFESVTEGRCNPAYIPYLYAAGSEKCCMYEVRPAKDDFVSVAEIQINEPLKILDFGKIIHFSASEENVLPNTLNSTLFLYLAAEFQRPSKTYGDYLFCQYVSEMIKNLPQNFDGIAYYSAACTKEGEMPTEINYVIFNYQKCRAISSILRKVTKSDCNQYEQKIVLTGNMYVSPTANGGSKHECDLCLQKTTAPIKIQTRKRDKG